MGWNCINDDCSVKFFSISDELKIITENVIGFFYNLSGGMYAIMVIFMLVGFVIYMFYYIRTFQRLVVR